MMYWHLNCLYLIQLYLLRVMRLFTRHICTTALFLLFILLSSQQSIHALPASSYAAESVLAKGKWVKIKVQGSQIHYISASDAKNWGFSNLNSIKIFGYGGAPISLVLNENQKDDLAQVPVLNTGSGIYFYAQGVTTTKKSSEIEYEQYQHPFATEAYYFVTDRDDIEQLAISTKESAEIPSGEGTTTYTERTFHEIESTSPCESGNYMLGEDFRFNTSHDFNFNLSGYVTGTELKILTAFAAETTGGSGSKLIFKANGTTLESSSDDNIPAMGSGYALIQTTKTVKTVTLTDESLDFNIQYIPTGTVLTANLDYITINYTANIRNNSKFRNNSAKCNMPYIISGCSPNTQIWDVTQTDMPFSIKGTLDGDYLKFSPADNGEREYAVFDADWTQATPTFVENISNQNIHGEPTPDMIIITPKEFQEQAQRIADLHLKLDSMRVLVATDNAIYNEFSSGTPDFMAYRKMAKMFYDRGMDESGHKLGYVLLFGRGTHDNRKLSSTVKALKYPMLLTWQTDNGSDEIESYSTDDILGMVADDSGVNIARDKMDISVGRMPVKSVTEAKNVVDKLYSYTTKQDFGTWKNNVLMIADDMNNAVHMEQADSVINNHKRYGGENYVYNRIYLDAFEVESSGSGRSYPEAKKKMLQKLNEGVLYLNFIGHSGNVGWTGDGLLNINDINNMYLKHFPLFLTASCEFTRLDKANETGGETLFLNPRGGAIALITSARQVLITDNGILNKNIAKYMFSRDADGKHLRLGDIVRLGKNQLNTNTNKLKFFLVGDPALRLAYPTYGVKLESINDNPVNDDNMPIFKARQSMTLKGCITDVNGNKATGFNGSVIPTLYDAEESVVTHGYGDDGKEYTFLDRSNKLSVSKDSVRNGEFMVKVAIPSEINAPSSFENYTPAMINFYASSNEGIEANGNNEQFYIYGYDNDIETDTIGPEIKMLVLNSESFKNGDNVNEAPMVIASISDESGINLSNSGIGHQMTLVLDETSTLSDVASYYTPDFSSEGNAGSINYSLSGLTEGEHSLRLKVWDTFNNSSEQTIQFNVITGLQPDLYEVYAVGNPATTEAKFYMKHNRPDALITLTLNVYDLMGRLVWSTKESGKSDMFTSFPITWDLTDMAGRRVPRGIYIYKAGISTDGVQETTKAKKIAVTAEK